MKLKSLEIKGFKSFADKTKVNFNENITGIVGPNGCGKSNIVDAIRWVLGEQKTSQLRLEKMDNVLFNGTKARKSTGLAEVSLTFENTRNVLATEFQEVTITRKLYRSGESEYRINDVTSRLKDIHNLFADSGIGSDSYAIIELGMVDDILQNKEQSRKRLFEQAASISKYKQRKKESLQKLKSTEENLERLQDILAEIEANLKSLESQARRAERYNTIKDEYKTLSLETIKSQVANYKKSYNEVYEKVKIENDKKAEIAKKIDEGESQLQKLKFESTNREKTLSEVQKTVNNLVSGINKNENERNLLRQEINHLKQSQLEIEKQIEVSKKEKEDIAKSIVDVEQKKNAFAASMSTLEKEKSEALEKLTQQERSLNENKTLFEDDKNEMLRVQREVFDLEKKQSIAQTKLEQLDRETKHLEQASKESSNNIKSLETELKKASQEKESSTKNLENLLAKEEKIQEKIKSINQELEAKKIDLHQTQRKLDSKKNEYQILKSMIDNLEGFPESIKYLKKNIPLYEDKNVFSDIVSCNDKYKIAIENLIKPYSNYFIVDKLSDAKKTLLELKNQNKGKVGLFVMELIPDTEKYEMPSMPKEFQSVLDIIKVDKQYNKLISYLFSSHFITEQEDISLSNKEKGITVINIDGTQMLQGPTISGGASNLFEGSQVGRSRNLEKLNEEIKKVESELSKIEKEFAQLESEREKTQNSSQSSEIESMRVLSAKANENFTSLSIKVEHLTSTQQSASERIDKMKEENKQLKEESQTVEKELEKTKKQLNVLTEKNKSQDVKLQEYFESYNHIKNQYNEIDLKYTKAHTELNQTTQQENFYKNRSDSETKKIVELEEKQKNQWEQEQTKTEQLSKMEMSIVDNYSDRENLEKQVEETEKAYFEVRNQIITSEKEIKEIQSQLQSQNEIIKSYEDRITEMRLEIQSVKERLRIEFDTDLDTFINSDLSTSMESEELESKLSRLKKRLETYGEVNPMAIEAFNEVKTRYDFLTTQRDDVLSAKEDLLETIKEIDTIAKDRFLTAFDQIRDNFIKTFRILFTEDDDCDLILTNPEDPIESDIEIIAKPKGKKPLTINQLSGGEKTLTATALLFSLYLLKPAPFCIFDEVDAPLDDTNIAKFNKIIEEFSKNSQFIIVTHNKQTMASVEVLYGVTMIEQGVSKLVPVDFRAIKEIA